MDELGEAQTVKSLPAREDFFAYSDTVSVTEQLTV
jgi:hypothetical protein